MFDYTTSLDGECNWVERLDGTRVRTLRGGSGPVSVVLSHGYGADMSEWNQIVSLLGDVGWVTLDMRGHGGTTIGSDGVRPIAIAGDYAAVLDHYHTTPPFHADEMHAGSKAPGCGASRARGTC